mgnify:CR=1 FL=1
MKSLNLLYAFLGGAIVGCSAALLFTPAKGEDVREKIREILRRKGIKVDGVHIGQSDMEPREARALLGRQRREITQQHILPEPQEGTGSFHRPRALLT